jgi:N-acetyl-anhydromuramyl-L-alanine amidase AmpD
MAKEQVRGVAVHYSGMNADEQRLHVNCAARVRGIQRYHMEENGWLDIAYNHVFCRHGFVFVGRGFGVRSAANGTKQANDHYFAICFLGDDSVGRADVTPDARRALQQLIAEYRRRYPKARDVRPHSDFFTTACPGDELRALITAF